MPGSPWDHDVIVLSGGSSVGARDYTTQVLARLPESELLVHGVAIRPGKPTIFGRAGSVLFWGLPGQPVSALITCQEFVLPSLRKLQGMTEDEPAPAVRAVLNRQLPSVHGRTDYVPVSLSRGPGGPGRHLRYSENRGRSAYWSARTDTLSFPNTWRALIWVRRSRFSPSAKLHLG